MPKGEEVRLDSAPTTVFNVVIEPNLSLDASTQTLYQQMASILDGYSTIPADRTTFYSALNTTPGFTVNNWEGWVDNVHAVCGGNLVTVAVFPTLSSGDYGDALSFYSNYSEQYLVAADGTFTYIGFLDPENQAGQPLGTVYGY